MSIIVTEGFQVNSNIAIDSRFVVGATAYGSNPPPFYSNRNAIVYKYPGLRIWDFNDNVPYVWNGTEWINENTTGAVIQNASSGNTGYQNFITKFANNTTLLTKSLLFDDASNVGLGLTGSSILPNGVVSNTTGVPLNTITPPLSQSPYKSGIHAAGNIRTNQYFSGDGRYIINLNAYNISSGYLSLNRITPPNGLPSDVYLLKNTLGVTTWDLASNIVPVPDASNIGSGENIYAGILNNVYQFKTLTSIGLDITSGTQSVNIDSKPGEYIGTDTSATRIYRFNNTTKIHEHFSLKSNSLKISQQLDGNGNITGNIMIEVPTSGSTDGLFVNSSYVPTYDDWDKGSKDSNGFYKGDGTLAKPFTNSIKYNTTTQQISSLLSDTAIENGINFYIGTGTKTYPQNANRLLTVQSPGYGGIYVYSGDFNINALQLKLEASMLSKTTGYLIDMDEAIDPATGTYIFSNTTYGYIAIDIAVNCQLQILGTLDPWNGGDSSQPQPIDGYKAVGGRLPGKGFRCSGNNVLTSTYATGKFISFTGAGKITSNYYSSTGPTTPNPLNIYLFTLDSTNGTQGGAPNITNGQNDGGIAINVACSVECRFQAIYYVNGNSKLQFEKLLQSGDLSNTFGAVGGDYYNMEAFVQKGGLVRLFNIDFGMGNGGRRSAFTFEPDDQFRISTSMIIRNSKFGGFADNWFHKKNIGPSDLDVTGCTTLYFGGYNLFRTTDSYTTTPSSALDLEGRGENWNGTKDKRWGSYWWADPSNGGSGPTASPAIGKPIQGGGSITFKDNTFESVNINQNCVDLTKSNSISVFNTIGGPVECLQRFEYFGLNYLINHANDYGLYKYGAFLYVDNAYLNTGATTSIGETYEIVSCTTGAITSPFWASVGYLASTLNYAPVSSFMGKGKPAQYKTFFCFAVATVPTGVVLGKIQRKTFF